MHGVLRGEIVADEPMARHTTWRTGGKADLFIRPQDRAELKDVLQQLQEYDLPWFVVGAGSNLLVRDGGIPGAVIHLGGLRRLHFGPVNDVQVEGGLPIMALIRECASRGLAGLEQMSGIPGTVGGAVYMNAGAGDQDMAGVVQSVLLLTEYGEQVRSCDQLDFSYRRSGIEEGEIVLETTLQFHRADAEDLQQEVRRRILARRQSQGVGYPNAGSVFKNPPGEHAWRMIDEAGLRGRRIGGAMVSEKHSNFIVNTGDATATDILQLMETIRSEVADRAGVVLEPEVRIVGVEANGD